MGGSGTWLAFGIGVGAGALAWFVLLLLLARRSRPSRLAGHRGTIERGIGLVLALLGAVLFARAIWTGA
jgi:hypothetical protein